jgi:DeoR/GlpR family transcriptional regulator of sugar metabolism
VALLDFLLGAGKATVAECEEELKVNGRTLQRDLKLLVEKAWSAKIRKLAAIEGWIPKIA